jgi:hypothetical protein
MEKNIERRLLYILHRGLVEARLLAQTKQYDQLFDLADALEPLPGYMDRWEDQHLESIRFNLKTYKEEHPCSSFDYLRYLEVDPTPPMF